MRAIGLVLGVTLLSLLVGSCRSDETSEPPDSASETISSTPSAVTENLPLRVQRLLGEDLGAVSDVPRCEGFSKRTHEFLTTPTGDYAHYPEEFCEVRTEPRSVWFAKFPDTAWVKLPPGVRFPSKRRQ